MVNLRRLVALSTMAVFLQAAVVHSTSLRRRLTDPAEDLNVAGDDSSVSKPLYTQEEVDQIVAETQAMVGENSGGNDNVYMLLIAICAGILVAVFSIWAYYFAAAGREERRQEQNTVSHETSPASETNEESIFSDNASDDDVALDEEMHKDEAISYDSRRPISHVHLGFTGSRAPPGRSNSEDASSIGHESQENDSVQSNNSIFSYMRGLRRAAYQLGGIQMMFHVNETDVRSQSHTSAEKESSSEEGGDVSIDSVESFSEDIEVSESDVSDDEADGDSSLGNYEDGEDPSLYTTVEPKSSAFSI